MTREARRANSIDLVIAARRVADFASSEGFADLEVPRRPSYDHLGAVIADSILQAGLNYKYIVKPRVQRILTLYPTVTTIDDLIHLICAGETGEFLDWHHPEKLARFDKTVIVLKRCGVNGLLEARSVLGNQETRSALLEINGIGPKTVDYMACLVGLDFIPIDRHIRKFAERVGGLSDNYDYLSRVFNAAADLLSISRRDFDSWVWQREANPSLQLTLAI